MAQGKTYTREELRALVESVERIRREGINSEQACARVGINYANFIYAKKRLEKLDADAPYVPPQPAPAAPAAPEPQKDKVVAQSVTTPEGRMRVVVLEGPSIDVLLALAEIMEKPAC